MECPETRELLAGYVDNELGVAPSAGIERHLAGCAVCRQAFQHESAVRSSLRRQALYFQAPEALRSSIRAAIHDSGQRAVRPVKRSSSWLSFGLAAAFSVAMTWALVTLWKGELLEQRLPQEIVAGHVRSLLVDHLADVETSDQHTIKPWFIGKLDFAPTVKDLTDEGFPLLGARLDYIENRPAAALVYRHGRHVINLFMWPAESGPDRPVKTFSRQSYQLANWTESGMFYCAVSDLASADMAEFALRFLGKEAPATEKAS